MKTEITLWYRKGKKGLSYNHYSDGFDKDQLYPISVSEDQKKAWKGCEWSGTKAFLIDGVVHDDS